MSKLRKLNVSEVEGNENSIFPPGTVWIDRDNSLRISDGQTEGGLPATSAADLGSFKIEGSTLGTRDNPNTGGWGGYNLGIDPGGESAAGIYIPGLAGQASGSALQIYNRGNVTSPLQLFGRGGVQMVTGNVEIEQVFEFSGNLLFLPPGGDIVDANGQSVLGGGVSTGPDTNIWIETFATSVGAGDIPQSATSIEYDGDGNAIALLVHEVDVGGGSTERYFSIAKFDTAGTKLWFTRIIGGGNTDGWGLAVDQVNNYVYVAGSLEDGGPNRVSTLSKLNGINGDLVWMKTYDFGYNSDSPVVDVATDGNPVTVGYVSGSPDYFVYAQKISAADGTVIWCKKLDGQNGEFAYGMAVGPAGEVVLTGTMDNLGLVNTANGLYADPVSNANWTNSASGVVIDGVTFDITFAGGVPTFTVTSDDKGGRSQDSTLGVIDGSTLGGASGTDNLTVKIGSVTAGSSDDRILVVKYDSVGSLQWQKAILFDAGYDTVGIDADIDSDGNVYISGSYRRPVGGSINNAICIVKLDSNGAKQWSRRIVGDCDDYAASIVVGPDDKLYLNAVTGNQTSQDFSVVLAKFEKSGIVAWQRILDNTSTWTFGGGLFLSLAAGSSLAVKNGYVAVAGTFGDPGSNPPYAMIAQVDTLGTLFSTGPWDYKGASFSGLLNTTASDIAVDPAGKTDSVITNSVVVGTLTPTTDHNDILVVTRYRQIQNLGEIGVDGVTFIGNGNDYGGGGLYIAPGPVLQANAQYWRFRGGDNANHLHLDTSDGSTYDQYFGDDAKYLKLAADGNISVGTSSRTWTFGTDGNLTLPQTAMNVSPAPTSLPGITFTDGTFQTTAYTGGGGGGAATTVDITDTNGLTTIYYPTFVESRTTGQYVRADVDLTYRTDTNTLSVSNLTTSNISFSNGTYQTTAWTGTVGNLDIENGHINFHSSPAVGTSGITYSDGTHQTTAYQLVAPPTHSTGAAGDRAGMVAYDINYHYYCKANYGQIGHQVSVATAFDGATALNTNQIKLTKTADTLQIAQGDIISDSDGGATSVVGYVSHDADFTYVGTGPGGSVAYSCAFPLTFTSTDYVSGGNIWVRVAWSGTSW